MIAQGVDGRTDGFEMKAIVSRAAESVKANHVPPVTMNEFVFDRTDPLQIAGNLKGEKR